MNSNNELVITTPASSPNMLPKDSAFYLLIAIACYLTFYNIRLSFELDTGDWTDLLDIDSPTQNVLQQQSNSSLWPDTNRTSQECRLQWDIEKKLNLINMWLERDLPILAGAVRQKDDMVYITLTQAHLRQNNNVAMDFRKIPWKCMYGTSATEKDQTHYEVFAEHVPTKRGDHAIVDLMCNFTMEENHDLVVDGISPTKLPNLNATVDRPFVYSIKKPLECDRLEELETSAIHKPKKIGACLRFKGEFDRAMVPQWIEYHRILGMEHFWVYINEEWNLTGLYNTSYITYIPFDLVWENHDSHFNHHYSSNLPEISQEPANSNCIWNAKKYGYDWVTTTDVDEYIRVPAAEDDSQKDVSVIFPLRSYLKRFDPNTIGCLFMRSIPYGQNKWLVQQDFPPNPLLIDYVWREKKNLSDFSGREKIIYNPQSVWSIGVHYCWRAQGQQETLHPERGDVYLQHYKLAQKGVFRKKGKIMVKSEEQLLKEPTLRDMYRSKVVSSLENLDALGKHRGK